MKMIWGCFFCFIIPIFAEVNSTRKLIVETDSFFDETIDYGKFSGRITDIDDSGTILKVSSENKNIKFLRAGDEILFKIYEFQKLDSCHGFVRSIEENYFAIFVSSFTPCYTLDLVVRRGTAIVINSSKLKARVFEASVYRQSLIGKKRDYLLQMNDVNNHVWNFEEKKNQLASEYDIKIAKIQMEKEQALTALINQKSDKIKLQRELAKHLDEIDKELAFYRVEKHELFFDRWHMDRDLGYPVYENPEPMRLKK